jgi:hypothetical protein
LPAISISLRTGKAIIVGDCQQSRFFVWQYRPFPESKLCKRRKMKNLNLLLLTIAVLFLLASALNNCGTMPYHSKHTLNIRKGVRIFGGTDNLDKTRIDIVALAGGRVRNDMFIDIAIYLDGKPIIAEDSIRSESTFTQFEITPGKHVLTIKSLKGKTSLQKELNITKSVWLDIHYDFYPGDHPEADKNGFKLDISDYPTTHR